MSFDALKVNKEYFRVVNEKQNSRFFLHFPFYLDKEGATTLKMYFLLCQAPSQNCETRLLASSCLSVRMKQLRFHWTDFDEILCLISFRKSVEKIKISLKCDKNKVYFTRRRYDKNSLNYP